MGIENSYINQIDKDKREKQEDIGLESEDPVQEIFSSAWPQFTIRKSSKEEDSGLDQIRRGKRIDFVFYINKKPVMTMQFTTAMDRRIIDEKWKNYIDHPFTTLDEMSPKDMHIPQTFVKVQPDVMRDFLNRSSDDLRNKIIEISKKGIIGTLEHDKDVADDKAYKDHIKMLLDIFNNKKSEPN